MKFLFERKFNIFDAMCMSIVTSFFTVGNYKYGLIVIIIGAIISIFAESYYKVNE